MEDKDLLNTIKKRNRVETNIDGFHMRRLKEIKRTDEERTNHSSRISKKEGSIIIELNENTHRLIMKERKVNVGWKKCTIFEHFNVKRCFKYWDYYHIAKYCTKEITCHQCAGNHTANKYMQVNKICINCKYKIQQYNIKISDGHDALSNECPIYQKTLLEKNRRAGMSDANYKR